MGEKIPLFPKDHLDKFDIEIIQREERNFSHLLSLVVSSPVKCLHKSRRPHTYLRVRKLGSGIAPRPYEQFRRSRYCARAMDARAGRAWNVL
ncbi:hypothetical protein BaRGS_00023790 [Batillaria attramentaria]|uniref:Ribosomal protein S14 n=1 Tax=Batillaria attramentaria TaxID=370345 RepID=A0ABD0KDB6_9CAEN